MATPSRSVPDCRRIKTQQIKSKAQLPSKDVRIVYRLSARIFIPLITHLNIPPSYATFMYDENLPMWTGAAKIWGVHTTWMRQNPEALMMFRAERIPDRAPFVVGRVCSLGECPLSGIWRWHNYIYGNTWKIRTEILENERRCDEGSRWINTHVNTESQLLTYNEELGYTHTLSSYLGLMIYKDSWTGWGNCPQA